MKRPAGFTLIELLVAMTTGSLLLALVGWSVGSLGRQLAPDPAAAQLRRLEAVAPMLTRMIGQAMPPEAAAASFGGKADQLRLVVAPPEAAEGAGPMLLTLSIRNGRGVKSLFATLRPVAEAAPFPPALGVERPLLEGYRDLSFEYERGAADPPLRPPRLVSLVLTAADGKVRRVSATPRLDSDGRCIFDPISLACR